jgi:hypothetical protein
VVCRMSKCWFSKVLGCRRGTSITSLSEFCRNGTEYRILPLVSSVWFHYSGDTVFSLAGFFSGEQKRRRTPTQANTASHVPRRLAGLSERRRRHRTQKRITGTHTREFLPFRANRPTRHLPTSASRSHDDQSRARSPAESP